MTVNLAVIKDVTSMTTLLAVWRFLGSLKKLLSQACLVASLTRPLSTTAVLRLSPGLEHSDTVGLKLSGELCPVQGL